MRPRTATLGFIDVKIFAPILILIILGRMPIKDFLIIMTHHYDIISGMFKSFGVTVSQSE